MDGLGIVVIFVLVLGLGVLMAVVRTASDNADIERWARENGYLIEAVEKTWFDNGPYWFRGKGRRIYRCRVRDAAGTRRTVYMRSRMFGNQYEFYDP